jgi:hypothetical protein
MRGRTKRKSTNEPQDLDPICSPHLEERLIGGNVDLDLLFQIPQEYARISGGIERKGKLFQGQQWRRERGGKATAQGGRRGLLYPNNQI